jgi:hypothetical protein
MKKILLLADDNKEYYLNFYEEGFETYYTKELQYYTISIYIKNMMSVEYSLNTPIKDIRKEELVNDFISAKEKAEKLMILL